MRSAIAIMAALLPACGKSATECRTEAEALSSLLVAAASEKPVFWTLEDGLRLVSRSDLPVTDHADHFTAPVVSVTNTETKFQGQPVASAAQLEDQLETAFTRMREDLKTGTVKRKHVPELRRVYFLIDEATSWQSVVSAVDAAARAGLTAPAFVFEQPSTITPPPRSAVDKELDAIEKSDDASNKATQVAKLMEARVKSCPALERAFGGVAPVEDKAMFLAKAIAPALVECECRVDIPELRSIMFRVIHVPRPTRVIAFELSAPAQPISLPASAPWAEASKRFTVATKNAQLVVAP